MGKKKVKDTLERENQKYPTNAMNLEDVPSREIRDGAHFEAKTAGIS
jgi:hypothetical protein